MVVEVADTVEAGGVTNVSKNPLKKNLFNLPQKSHFKISSKTIHSPFTTTLHLGLHPRAGAESVVPRPRAARRDRRQDIEAVRAGSCLANTAGFV